MKTKFVLMTGVLLCLLYSGQLSSQVIANVTLGGKNKPFSIQLPIQFNFVPTGKSVYKYTLIKGDKELKIRRVLTDEEAKTLKNEIDKMVNDGALLIRDDVRPKVKLQIRFGFTAKTKKNDDTENTTP